MSQERTQQLPGSPKGQDLEHYLQTSDPKLVVMSEENSGMHLPLDRVTQTLGRGPGVDLVFDDPTLSRRHAIIEFNDGQFHVRDLDSTNGILLNGKPVTDSSIQHGDQIEIGGQVFKFLIEEREDTPHTYELS